MRPRPTTGGATVEVEMAGDPEGSASCGGATDALSWRNGERTVPIFIGRGAPLWNTISPPNTADCGHPEIRFREQARITVRESARLFMITGSARGWLRPRCQWISPAWMRLICRSRLRLS